MENAANQIHASRCRIIRIETYLTPHSYFLQKRSVQQRATYEVAGVKNNRKAQTLRDFGYNRGFKQTVLSQHAHTFRTISVWRRIPDVRPSVSVTRIPTSSETNSETVCCMEKHHVLDMKMPFSCWEHV